MNKTLKLQFWLFGSYYPAFVLFSTFTKLLFPVFDVNSCLIDHDFVCSTYLYYCGMPFEGDTTSYLPRMASLKLFLE